jgi:hypothetical protein
MIVMNDNCDGTLVPCSKREERPENHARHQDKHDGNVQKGEPTPDASGLSRLGRAACMEGAHVRNQKDNNTSNVEEQMRKSNLRGLFHQRTARMAVPVPDIGQGSKGTFVPAKHTHADEGSEVEVIDDDWTSMVMRPMAAGKRSYP